MNNLRILILQSSLISKLPLSLGKLKNLTELDLRYTRKLESVPDEIGSLDNLQKLAARESYISSLPNSIGQLKNLKDLDLSRTKKLQSLPGEIGNLSNLHKLNVSDGQIFHHYPILLET